MGALTTARSDWSATIGGTTVVIIRSESTLATTSEEARRIIGWRLVRETRWVFLAELWSTFSGIAGSRMSDVFRERSLQIQFSVTILGNCPAYIGYWNGHIPFLRSLGSPWRKCMPYTFRCWRNCACRWQLCGWTALSPSIDYADSQCKIFASAKRLVLRQSSGPIALLGVGRSVI